ncbi:MAG: diphthine--ammonia ligase [Candidatus Geothermarchaeales archaeon]
MRVSVLYSGGKDSNFSAYLASRAGHEIACLVSMLPQTDESYMFHYPNVHLTELQAAAMEVPYLRAETKGEKEKELGDLRELLLGAIEAYGVEGLVTGAVASEYQKSRVESLCRNVGLGCLSPLWGVEPAGYMRALIRTGFDVMIVGVSALGLGRDWLGRRLDEGLVEELVALNRKYGVHVAFEGGEAETFVLDSPLFRKRIELLETEEVWLGDRGRLTIKRAELADKGEDSPRREASLMHGGAALETSLTTETGG